ncbi:hypothetical protein ESB00_17815 [Oleiharenicola lentus]|uniref:ORC1/DEAH AAA+ ATPase domain-containing protein n=1 Tax=Oleiharenicola lentus TaxID=2508720 RepID=A0A4Q1C532_9BACT|nr:TniB family NTP-binding protein [Oleiharenicola lentus]RXK53548.1 hypothetical protein ESB00_17815 [Oleiharenicola lentus]
MQNPDHIRAAQKAKAALDNSLVKHTRFDEALKTIEAALLFPTDTRLLWVIGPSGAGKTRLAQTVEKLIHKIVADKLVSDPGCVPCVSFEVPCPELGHRFSWNEHHWRYLDKLQSPLSPDGANWPPLPRVDPKRGLEHAVLNALHYRNPLGVLLDETNHFASVTSGKVLFDQTNRLKSFANRSRVLHICFGTYEVAQMASISGQLARRSDIIHLSRYRADVTADYAAFKSVVRAFQKCLPVVHHLDLRTQTEYLHERSIGLVGVLKGWLIKALAHANGDGRSAITMKDLEATAMPVNKLRLLLHEATEGEHIMNDGETQLDLFRKDLGLGGKPPRSRDGTGDLFGSQDGEPEPAEKTPFSKAKPFELAPERLPVGGAFDGSVGALAG